MSICASECWVRAKVLLFLLGVCGLGSRMGGTQACSRGLVLEHLTVVMLSHRVTEDKATAGTQLQHSSPLFPHTSLATISQCPFPWSVEANVLCSKGSGSGYLLNCN